MTRQAILQARPWVGCLAACGLMLGACVPAVDVGRGDQQEVLPDLAAPQVETAADEAAPVVSPYGQGWIVNEFWGGEYPNAFTVISADMSVKGRAVMDRAAPRDVACALPRHGNYSPWNSERVEADGLIFVSANPISAVTVTGDVVATSYNGETPAAVELSAGDTLDYLYYVGEGYFMASVDGVETLLLEEDIRAQVDLGEVGRPDEWVNVSCNDGTRAWLLYAETIETPGIAISTYDNYGSASDVKMN